MVGGSGSSPRAPKPRAPHVRLVPPRLGETERRTRTDRDARRWADGLHGHKRRWLWMAAGNVLLLALLVGLPFVRGQARARDAQRAYHELAGCLYGGRVTGGLGAPVAEAELLAAQRLRLGSAWPSRCARLLDAVVPAPALFVLPSVKQAEARVRDAAEILRTQLAALAAYAPGAPLPELSASAVQLLRTTLSGQLEQAGIGERGASLPMQVRAPPTLAVPARLPLYAAPDAELLVEGNDQTLRVSALDDTGLSYLELEPGQPFTRARMVRPRLLRGMLGGELPLLLWATPAARCAERATGCFGKTTQVAVAPRPLLELPEARALAMHLSGRPDRSVAVRAGGLLLATASDDRRVLVRELPLPRDFVVGEELPPLSATRSWARPVDQALVLSSETGPVVLGLSRHAGGVQLTQLSAEAARPIASLASSDAAWLTGCAAEGRLGFVFGAGDALRVGELARDGSGALPRLWEELRADAPSPIDPERRSRDRIVASCTRDALVVLVRDAGEGLTAVVCRGGEGRCRSVVVATGVDQFAALPTASGLLLAYAGRRAPQIRVRRLNTSSAEMGPERVPAACWSSGKGMCRRPTLARLGSRILLLAPERTDLAVIESADEGESWRAPPLL